MKSGHKILIAICAAIFVACFVFAYLSLVKTRHYIVRYKIPCDPNESACFIEICDPEISTECTGNEEEDTSYYTTMFRSAHNIPSCDDYNAEECIKKLETCMTGEDDCYQETCEQAQQEDETIECSENSPLTEGTVAD